MGFLGSHLLARSLEDPQFLDITILKRLIDLGRIAHLMPSVSTFDHDLHPLEDIFRKISSTPSSTVPPTMGEAQFPARRSSNRTCCFPCGCSIFLPIVGLACLSTPAPCWITVSRLIVCQNNSFANGFAGRRSE